MIKLIAFTVWTVTLTTGLLGFLLAYDRPRPPEADGAYISTEILQIRFSEAILPNSDKSPLPPDLSEKLIEVPLLEEPPPIKIADLTDTLTPIMDAVDREFARAASPNIGSLAKIRPLTFGLGEGRQPAPRYPYRAFRDGQEGVVTVLFTVDAKGRVTQAELKKASPWPLLNESALKTIRERWRFSRGESRRFEIKINFTLKE